MGRAAGMAKWWGHFTLYQCGLDLSLGVDADIVCASGLLLVLAFAPKGFFPRPDFPIPSNTFYSKF